MKNFLILLLAMTLGFAGNAQKKPKINKANSYRETGELVLAKEIIDQAIEYEKTKDDGKTWYYRGLIYATIDTTSNEQYANLKPGALQEAMKSFNKALEIDEPTAYYTNGSMGLPVFLTQQIDAYYAYYFNQAITFYQAEDFQGAVDNFKSSYYILPEDTNAYTNAGYAAHSGQLYDEAKAHYQLAIDKGAKSKDIFSNYVAILTAKDENHEKALEIIRQGREIYPSDPTLARTEINLLIQLGRTEDARANLEAEIVNDPQNPNLYFTLGVLNEELDMRDKAIDAYKRALAVDPNHYESNFNYGVILINKANEIIKQSNSLGISKADMKKARELEPQIEARLKEALPQWEKVYEVKPTDKTAVETLAYIYNNLAMYDKYKEMSKLLEDM